MAKDNVDEIPRNAIEAQGFLIKAVYKKYGVEVLSIIKNVCGKHGKSLGLRVKRKLPNNNFATVAKAFSKSFDQNFVKIISISDEKFQIHGIKCPFGLENTSRELCEAVMAIDHEYFREAVSDNIQLKILKTVAAGDPYCDTVYEIKT